MRSARLADYAPLFRPAIPPVDSVAEADTLLKALPLGQADLLTFDLMPIGPLALLGMLIR